MLTAAVVEGNYDVVFKALALLSHSEIMMTAVADTLANRETKRPGHHKIYRRTVEKVNTLSELHQCSRGNDSEKAVELVLNDGLGINTPGLCNRTPLLWASFSSSGKFIQTLIDLGANVNAQRTDDKVTPLILSADWNNFMAVNLLWIMELMLISPELMHILHCTLQWRRVTNTLSNYFWKRTR